MPGPSHKLLSVQNPKSIAGMWIFTFLWCGISFTAFWAFAIASRQTGGAVVSGLFVLLGFVMLYGSVKATLEYLKYGRVHLALEGEQPAAGRSFSARLELPGAAGTAMTIHAELACVQATWSQGSKGGPSRSERDVWTRKNVFPVRRGAASGYSTLRFDLPADQPASDLPGEGAPDAILEVGHPAGIEIGRSYYRWELRVKADVPGIDLDRTFKLRVAPAPLGERGAAAQPAFAGAPRLTPAMSEEIERRMEIRRAIDRRLSTACAVIGLAPFLAPFAIAGLAVGLAGCPMSWSMSKPPSCEFAGIDWGPLMSGAFDLMFVAVPAGIALSAIVYFVGRVVLDRRHGMNSFGGQGGLAIGLVVLGLFLYQGWKFMRPARTTQPMSSQNAQLPAAREDASNVGRGYQAQYVNVTGKYFTAEVHDAQLRVRIGEIRLETTGRLPDTSYYSLGINVYQRGRDLGSAYNWETRGNLTAGTPSMVLNDQVFNVPGAGAACAQGGCEARLLLAVRTGSNSSHGENTDFAALTLGTAQQIPLPASGPPKYWDTHFARGMSAFSQNHYDEAERRMFETLNFIEKNLSAEHPAAARVQYQLSVVYERQKKPVPQEQALLRALEILEKHPDEGVKKALGAEGAWLDKEMVARGLGDFYWEQRRYEKGYVYYDRAYRHVPQVQTSEYSRNLRLARNSAGRMATACTQRNWEVADQAMKELKERIVKVDAEARKQLEYWIRTGEPRLAARNC